MKRTTAPVLILIPCAIVISALAIPAIGNSPPPQATQAPPGQLADSPLGTDSPSGRLGDLAFYRSQALQALTTVGEHQAAQARADIAELQAAWQRSEQTLRALDPQKWDRIARTIGRAEAQLKRPGDDVILGKAALLDVLSAMDAPDAIQPPAAPSLAQGG